MADLLSFLALGVSLVALCVNALALLRLRSAFLARLHRLEQLEAERSFREAAKATCTVTQVGDALEWRDGEGVLRMKTGVW